MSDLTTAQETCKRVNTEGPWYTGNMLEDEHLGSWYTGNMHEGEHLGSWYTGNMHEGEHLGSPLLE